MAIALPTPTTAAALAAHRFGLGLPSLDAIGADPPGWLEAQIGPADRAVGDGLLGTDRAIERVHAEAEKRRRARNPPPGSTAGQLPAGSHRETMLADARSDTLAARSMVLETARRRDRGEDVAVDAACCKLFASEACGRVADRAVQVFGGAGYIADYGIERFYRDVRLFRIYEGTSQIQQMVIARGMVRAAEEAR